MRQTCSVCGKEAIGMQILGCCTAIVCEEHAEPMLRELRPGELKEWGICCFLRFSDETPVDSDGPEGCTSPETGEHLSG